MSLNNLNYFAATEAPNRDIFSGVRGRDGFEAVDAECVQTLTGEEALSVAEKIVGETLGEGDVVLILQILSESEHVRGRIALAMSSLVRGLVAPNEIVKLLVARDRNAILRIVSQQNGSCTYTDTVPFIGL